MTDKIPLHIKLDERNHVEKTLFDQLDGPGWDILALMQDLLTGKKCVTTLLTRVDDNDNGRCVD